MEWRMDWKRDRRAVETHDLFLDIMADIRSLKAVISFFVYCTLFFKKKNGPGNELLADLPRRFVCSKRNHRHTNIHLLATNLIFVASLSIISELTGA